jgi:predicted HTH transcriptional regulator
VCSGDATWRGNVYDFFFRILARLSADIRVPFAMSDAVSRIDDTDVHKAVREALVNALVHADYFGRQGIVVEKEFRRISISNPGVFRISRDVAISGGTSDARNARLFNIFSLVDVGERSGSGLCNIFHVWRATGNPTPTVFETFDPERIEFVLEMKPETVGESKEKSKEKTAQSKEKTAQSKEKSKEKTAQSKEKILGILADNPFVTIAEMVSSTGLSVSGVEKGLRELKSTGRIRRVGPDKGGRWEVIKASAP